MLGSGWCFLSQSSTSGGTKICITQTSPWFRGKYHEIWHPRTTLFSKWISCSKISFSDGLRLPSKSAWKPWKKADLVATQVQYPRGVSVGNKFKIDARTEAIGKIGLVWWTPFLNNKLKGQHKHIQVISCNSLSLKTLPKLCTGCYCPSSKYDHNESFY